MKWVVASCCAYEAAAICSRGHLPMITDLDRRTRHAVAPVIIAGLAWHFYGRPASPAVASLDSAGSLGGASRR